MFQSLKEAKVLKSKENKKINKKDKSLREVKVKQNLKEENQLVIGKNLLKNKLKISKIKTQLTNRQIQEKEEDLNQPSQHKFMTNQLKNRFQRNLKHLKNQNQKLNNSFQRKEKL